jgi:geranylgeranylglycerol-phosphate geranylgeranyltransferase
MSFSSLKQFFFAYLKTMRLYYGFVTGIAGWLGVSFYYHLRFLDFQRPMTPDEYPRGAMILAMLFASWGINQVVNDWLGLEEDRVNAPNRPMVTGELNPKWALRLSGFLMGCTIVISYLLNPHSIIPALLGVILNIVYNYSKAWGLWGNLIFGLMISTCTMYGFLASGPTPSPLFTSSRISVLYLVVLMNGLMTYFTYFKDYEGDKAAGKRTFIVRHGVERASRIGIFGAFLPTLSFFFIRWMDWLPFAYTDFFIYCAVMTVFLQIWTAVRFYQFPSGPRAYFSNATNFRACACGQVALISMFNGVLALYLFSLTYIFIGFLFGFHEDDKA